MKEFIVETPSGDVRIYAWDFKVKRGGLVFWSQVTAWRGEAPVQIRAFAPGQWITVKMAM